MKEISNIVASGQVSSVNSEGFYPSPADVYPQNYQSFESQQLAGLSVQGGSSLVLAFRRWQFLNPDAKYIPARFQPLLNRWERQAEVESFRVRDNEQLHFIEKIKKELESDLPGHNKRRKSELELADYIEREIAPYGGIQYQRGGKSYTEHPHDIAAKLRSCRQVGRIGLKPAGAGYVVAYDDKCGFSKLCPDEAREESKRLNEVYIPALVEHKKQHRGNTHQYAVFTLPNYAGGELAQGKKEIHKRFSKLLKTKCMQHVAGCLVVQEDPLSKHDDWNVHLNVMLAIDGEFDWSQVRKAWGGNIHFESESDLRAKTKKKLEKRGIDTSRMDDITVLTHAFMELVKYSSAPVSAKSSEKAASGSSKAPPMVQWGAKRWIEWWVANKGFRRTRSYGCLYDPEGYRWKVAGQAQRASWLRSASLSPDLSALHWRKKENSLNKEQRDLLRDAMNEREVLDMDKVEWVGTMRYHSDGGYRVLIDLIPEDKFSSAGGTSTETSCYSEVRPPDIDVLWTV